MIGALVRLVSTKPLLSVVLVLIIAGLGVHSYRELPIDAVPDVSRVQVQVLASAPGLSPLEVENQVTQQIERALSGVPHLSRMRSVSRAGIGALTLVFDDGTDIMLARELTAQRLPSAREAAGASVDSLELGPLTTGLGEVYHFTTTWPGHELSELRTLMDWEVAPRLARVPGVVEVNSWGGDRRQIVVAPERAQLLANGVTESALADAVIGGGQNTSAGMIERGEEGTFLRIDATYRTVEQIAAQVVRVIDAPSGKRIVTVGEVATVGEGRAPRFSAATADGNGETLYTMVQMMAGENAHRVVASVKNRLEELKPTLPQGVTLEPFYDRAAFVDDVLSTVKKNLLEGGVIVTMVLLLMLGSLRAGLVVASVIPLSMLGAFSLMRLFGVSGNLLSLGAIDFGLVVDGAVVVVEGALTTMAVRRMDARHALARVGSEVGRPVTLAVLIIGIVYVPILLLEGVEGRLFRPMALTVLFALATAFVLTFTWVPTLATWVLPQKPHGEPALVRRVRLGYEALLRPLLLRPVPAIGGALVLLGTGAYTASTLGGEFVPRLEEGGLAIQLTRPPSVSLEEAVAGTTKVEQALARFPEVRRVVSRIGSPDVATDVMGIEQADVLVSMAPRSEWTTATDAASFSDALAPVLREALPGAGFGFTQPIEMRVSELIGGVQSDLGVKVFGEDLGELRQLADSIAKRLSRITGAADVRVEPSSGLATWTVTPLANRLAAAGIATRELTLHGQALRQGVPLGKYREGLRSFDIVMRSEQLTPFTLTSLNNELLLGPGQTLVPLSQVATVKTAEGPAQVSREQGRRRILVEANVRGRDLASFVQEVQDDLSHLQLPSGYYLEFGGQYENLARAAKRMMVVVPGTLAVVLFLLYLAFGRLKPALLVFMNVPAAATGGAFALALRGLDLSMSAAVGFLALFGVATLNGVVLMSAILNNRYAGSPAYASVYDAASERLRPVVTTALVAALGFLPMAIAAGTGAEVQRPLATVVIGGLVTSTLMTLFVLPAVTLWFSRSAAVSDGETS